MSLAMSRAEREAFLAATHVGIVSITEEGRGPLTIPVWYRYEPGGELRFATGDTSRKARLLQRAGRASLCVQTETPPYKYVSVEGPISIAGAPDHERDVREVALRYLGPEMGEMYLAATVAEHENAVLVRLRPEGWLTADFSRFGR